MSSKNCSIHLVGEADQRKRSRFNLHSSSIRNSQKVENCNIFCDHYQKGIFKSAAYTVQIPEALPENTTATVAERKKPKGC